MYSWGREKSSAPFLGVYLRKLRHKTPSSPLSLQVDLFIASDVTGLLWWSLVTADYAEGGTGGGWGVKWGWLRCSGVLGWVCYHWGKPCCSPAPPICHVSPIRCGMLSHITVLDTAHPHLLLLNSVSVSLCFLELGLSFSNNCIITIFHLSGTAIAGALEASWANNRNRGNFPVLCFF